MSRHNPLDDMPSADSRRPTLKFDADQIREAVERVRGGRQYTAGNSDTNAWLNACDAIERELGLDPQRTEGERG